MNRIEFIDSLMAKAQLDQEIRANHMEVVVRFKVGDWEEDAVIIASPPTDKWIVPETEVHFYFCATNLFEILSALALRIEDDGFYSFDGAKKVSFDGHEAIHQLCAAKIRELMA